MLSTQGDQGVKDDVRVVITGMGTVNPLGLDVETTWQNLLAGKSGVRRFERFDVSSFRTQIAAEVRDFDATDFISPKEARRMDRFVQFAMASTAQALEQANLRIDKEIADHVGVIFGTGIGGLTTIDEGYRVLQERGPRRVNPLTSAMMLPNMAAAQISISFGPRGPNYCIISACATGSNVVGEAFETIRRGDAQAMVAGSSEAPMVAFGLAAYDRTLALSARNDAPEKASRPFDAKRDGFVFAEGAGSLILENVDFAHARDANILAEIIGYGASCDAFHITAPAEGGGGAALAMARALEKAGLDPQEIDYINAHGTSTPLNDKNETRAIKEVFGDYAYQVPISSTKSMTGHLLGSAGVVEAIVCIKTIQEGIIHPTINYEYPDPDCDLDYVPKEPRKARVKTVLSNSFGFGGHNACLVLKEPSE
jgi:3-oxoacyl-[acyl-carrier-protein] synthase II